PVAPVQYMAKPQYDSVTPEFTRAGGSMEREKWAPTLGQAIDAAEASGRQFGAVLRHGTLLLGLYAPQGRDPQGPHTQDEVYIVAEGESDFVRDGERVHVGPGDALFVPAGMEHRFENFGDDLKVWVVFYGP